jgi:peptide/nickel transport system ATP-binding protein
MAPVVQSTNLIEYQTMTQTLIPQDPTILLKVNDLKTYFYSEEGEIHAVDGVSFSMKRGKTLAIVGESGCGKSVTSYSILRLIQKPGQIKSGQMWFMPSEHQPINIAKLKEGDQELYHVRGGLASMIFQEPMTALSPVHTIGNQISEAILLHQTVDIKQAMKMAGDMLAKVGIPNAEVRLKQYPHELSGGMRQRAVIAMALVCNPQLLIADEPTTALDVTIQAQILDLLKSLQKELGTGILLITHDLGVVAQTADEVAVMYLGRIVERGDVRTILKNPRHPYTQGLLKSLPSMSRSDEKLPSIEGSVPALTDIPTGCPFHPRCPHAKVGVCDIGLPPSLDDVAPEHQVACVRVNDILNDDLIQHPSRERVKGKYEPSINENNAPTKPILEVKNLCKFFPIMSKGLIRKQVGTVKACNNISFKLMPGKTLGLVGESGSGKTTTGRAILRAINPTSGQVLFHHNGQQVDLAKLTDAQLKPMRTELQMIFQDPFASLNPRMTVQQIVAEPLVIHGLARGKELEDRVVNILKRVGIRPEYRSRYPHAFSGGQRQRIGIARALILNPSLIVADEAVSALDVSVQAQVINLLDELQQEFGLTYIFIAHDLSVVKHLCDEVAVMYAGQIVEQSPTDQLFADPKHPYSKALLSAVPHPDPDVKMRNVLSGEVADLTNLPQGCAFAPRCSECIDQCIVNEPPMACMDHNRLVKCIVSARTQ